MKHRSWVFYLRHSIHSLMSLSRIDDPGKPQRRSASSASSDMRWYWPPVVRAFVQPIGIVELVVLADLVRDDAHDLAGAARQVDQALVPSTIFSMSSTAT